MNKIYIILLSIVHLFSHYLPFERKSIGVDSYANLLHFKGSEGFSVVDYFSYSSDRSINFIFLDLQNSIINANTK
jgi:hypothetical protein|tara:strand:+ start:9211 stop:9435 length:225 start_codon:yes stop_codon:yes gene_type:complete